MLNSKQPYLTEQVITYLGNKRKLLNFIDISVEDIIKNDSELANKKKSDIAFFDIFSGSGIVSRYANFKGYTVYANDLEIYSSVINMTMLNITPNEAQKKCLHAIKMINKNLKENIPEDGDSYQNLILFLNQRVRPIKEESRYFSIHYAPKDTNNPDFHNERLFYTQENALWLDAVVEIIHDDKLVNNIVKNLILTSVMYLMTKHINTSGTMKGFHNGWGGTNNNALERIMTKMEITKLPLLEHNKYNRIYNHKAENVFQNEIIPEIDIIYADPPYNQHQYSANYNHLTTICLNDKYDPGEVIQGSRAGIRKEHNRSDFCKSQKNKETNKKEAEIAFINFITSIECKYIIMSYNNEGVVNINELLNILSQDGKNHISVKEQDYQKYRGGKNTVQCGKVIEYLLIIQMNKTQSQDELNILKTKLISNNLKRQLKDAFINYNELEEPYVCEIKNGNILISKNDINILEVDAKTYRILFEYDNAEIKDDILFLLSKTLNKTQRMELHIKEKNIDLALQLLNGFNIKKLKSIKEDFQKRINEIQNEKLDLFS
jgi:adenine-specific DNA-methyltransferase